MNAQKPITSSPQRRERSLQERLSRMRVIVTAALLLVGIVAAVTPARAAESRGVTLVREGEARSVIVMAEDAPEHTAKAARTLREYLEKISGAEVDIIGDPAGLGDRAGIWVGAHPGLADRGIELDFGHPEEIRIFTEDGQLVIAGRDRVEAGRQIESGTAQAVYAFIGEHLGVRWLWPGELGEDLTERETIALDPIDHRYHPQLRQRRLRTAYLRRLEQLPGNPGVSVSEADKEAARRKDELQERWLRLHHMDASMGDARGSFRMNAGHAFLNWWDRYGEAHPEYFALQPDGTRGTFPEKPKYKKLNVAEPGVHEQWLDNTERSLRADPSLRTFSASPNDGSNLGISTDPESRAWDPEGPTVDRSEWSEGKLTHFTAIWKDKREKHVALTDRYAKFWNTLARGLRERFPGQELFIGAWAYNNYATPPVETKLEPEIVIGFVDGTPGVYGGMFAHTPEGRARDKALWRSWAERVDRLVWRPNLFHTPSGRFGLPQLEMDRMAEDMRFLAENSVMGIDVDSLMGHWAMHGPEYYLLARLVWDPQADAKAILEDYYRRGFGLAAEPIREFYEFLEEKHYELFDVVEGLDQRERYPYFPDVYDGATLDHAAALLDEAAEAAASPEARAVVGERVAFVRRGLVFMRANVELINAQVELRENRTTENLRRAAAAYERVEELLRSDLEDFAFSPIHYRNFRGGNDYLGAPADPGVLSALENNSAHVAPLSEWTFRKDQDADGFRKGWYAGAGDDKAWRELKTPGHWKHTWVGDYLGYGWYRTRFTMPEDKTNADVTLYFEGVDEQAWVFLNGRLVGEHSVASEGRKATELWNEPFAVRIDNERLRAEGENTLTVLDHASKSTGGIWAPVWMVASDAGAKNNPELRPDQSGPREQYLDEPMGEF